MDVSKIRAYLTVVKPARRVARAWFTARIVRSTIVSFVTWSSQGTSEYGCRKTIHIQRRHVHRNVIGSRVSCQYAVKRYRTDR